MALVRDFGGVSCETAAFSMGADSFWHLGPGGTDKRAEEGHRRSGDYGDCVDRRTPRSARLSVGSAYAAQHAQGSPPSVSPHGIRAFVGGVILVRATLAVGAKRNLCPFQPGTGIFWHLDSFSCGVRRAGLQDSAQSPQGETAVRMPWPSVTVPSQSIPGRVFYPAQAPKEICELRWPR